MLFFSISGGSDDQQYTTLPNIVQHGTGDSANQVLSAQHKAPQNGGGFPKAPMLAMIEERSFESQASVESPIIAPTLKNSSTLDILNSKSSGVNDASNALSAPLTKPQRLEKLDLGPL